MGALVRAQISFNHADFATQPGGSISFMDVIDPPHLFWGLECRNLEIHNDWLLAASHEDAFERLLGAGVDLLMGNVRRNVDKVAGAGFRDKLELFAPTHARATFDDVDDAFKLSVVMRPGLGVRMDGDGSGPEFRGAGSRVCDRRSTAHSGRLRRVSIEVARVNDTNSMMFPVSRNCHSVSSLALISAS